MGLVSHGEPACSLILNIYGSQSVYLTSVHGHVSVYYFLVCMYVHTLTIMRVMCNMSGNMACIILSGTCMVSLLHSPCHMHGEHGHAGM